VHITESRVSIAAPRETVWAVLTDPAYIRQWQYGSVVTTDWSPGSPIRFTSQWQDRTFEQWGTVLAVDVPAELRYSLFAPRPDLADEPGNYFTMIYTLEPGADGTLLTITQEDPRAGAGDGSDGSGDDSGGDDSGGENPVLAALKNLAESARPGGRAAGPVMPAAPSA